MCVGGCFACFQMVRETNKLSAWGTAFNFGWICFYLLCINQSFPTRFLKLFLAAKFFRSVKSIGTRHRNEPLPHNYFARWGSYCRNFYLDFTNSNMYRNLYVIAKIWTVSEKGTLLLLIITRSVLNKCYLARMSYFWFYAKLN